jgi:outer membrane protein assembly factor BamD (BamD/ComL family)
LCLLAALGGCASSGQGDLSSLASNSDEIVWQAAEKAFQKKQWEGARKLYRRIIDGFPQSEHIPAARLGTAESYFNEGGTANYILAISEYREFLTLYPSHPRSDYAQATSRSHGSAWPTSGNTSPRRSSTRGTSISARDVRSGRRSAVTRES